MRDVKLLHPNIRAKCFQLVKLAKIIGIDIIITQTLRTQEEQDALYAQGRTTSGNIVTNALYPNSPHCWGVAFDFAVLKNGKVDWEDIIAYNRVGWLAKQVGLFWGGDFKTFIDRPHIEDPFYVKNNSVKWLKSQYGTPEAFIKSYIEEETAYKQAIQKLVIHKKINSPDYWLNLADGENAYPDYVVSMLKIITKTNNLSEAIILLRKNNIITSVDYWLIRIANKINLETTYVKKVIIKAVNLFYE